MRIKWDERKTRHPTTLLLRPSIPFFCRDIWRKRYLGRCIYSNTPWPRLSSHQHKHSKASFLRSPHNQSHRIGESCRVNKYSEHEHQHEHEHEPSTLDPLDSPPEFLISLLPRKRPSPISVPYEQRIPLRCRLRPAPTMPPNGKTKGRFELPALVPINYSLTEGTSIPPPPISPVEETTPAAAPKGTTQSTLASIDTLPAASTAPPRTSRTSDGRGRTSEPPLSPASSRRPSSLRRFLSRKSLHGNYTNGMNYDGTNENLAAGGRPESPSSFMTSGPPAKKRGGNWFKRLSTINHRTSIVYEDEPVVKQHVAPVGPPPPKLPELSQLKAKISDNDGGSLGGGELFKNIS